MTPERPVSPAEQFWSRPYVGKLRSEGALRPTDLVFSQVQWANKDGRFACVRVDPFCSNYRTLTSISFSFLPDNCPQLMRSPWHPMRRSRNSNHIYKLSINNLSEVLQGMKYLTSNKKGWQGAPFSQAEIKLSDFKLSILISIIIRPESTVNPLRSFSPKSWDTLQATLGILQHQPSIENREREGDIFE